MTTLFDVTLDLARMARGVKRHKVSAVSNGGNTLTSPTMENKSGEYVNGTVWIMTGDHAGEFFVISRSNNQSLTIRDSNITVSVGDVIMICPWIDFTKEYFTQAKLYSCKIWENDILIRDFIPCERDSDNKQGLYDLVNDTFYPLISKLYFVSATGQNVSGIYIYSSQGYASYISIDQYSNYLRIRANSGQTSTGVAGITRCVTKNSYNVKDYSKITYDFSASQGGGKVNVTFGYSPYKNPATSGYTNLYASGDQSSIGRTTKSYSINLQNNVYFYFIARNSYRPDCLTNLMLYKVFLE